jgi:hypothetical protein
MPLSTFLDGQEPTRLRGLAWLSLSDTGHVVRGSATSDSGGGVSTVWGTASTVVCRIDPIGDRGQGRTTGGRIDERSTHVVTLPAGTDVVADDRFLIVGRGTFEVTAVRERTREWAEFVEVVGT